MGFVRINQKFLTTTRTQAEGFAYECDDTMTIAHLKIIEGNADEYQTKGECTVLVEGT